MDRTEERKDNGCKKLIFKTDSTYRAPVSIKKAEVDVIDGLVAFDQTTLVEACRIFVVSRLSGVHRLGVANPVRKEVGMAGDDRPKSVTRQTGQVFWCLRPDQIWSLESRSKVMVTIMLGPKLT